MLIKDTNGSYNIAESLLELENDLCELYNDLVGKINATTDIDTTCILLDQYEKVTPLFSLICKVNES